jgi:hypothetical protein
MAMKRNSIVNAFTLLSRKPLLLLLLVPTQALPLLAGELLPGSDTAFFTPESMLKYILVLLAFLAATLLLRIAGAVFLMPPAMELLHDGAAGEDTPNGWYGRGFRRHWWKPAVAGLITGFLEFCVVVMVTIALIILLFLFAFVLLMFYMDYHGDGVSDSTINLVPFIAGTSISLFINVIFLIIQSFFALLLPASADRGFGKAFKLMFSAAGIRKFPKLLGGYLLTGVVSLAVFAAFAAAYVLLSGPTSIDDAITVYYAFTSGWTGFFVLLFASVLYIYRTAYQFSVYQEIRDREAGAAAFGITVP